MGDTVNVRVDADLFVRAQLLAQHLGMPVAALINEALRRATDDHPRTGPNFVPPARSSLAEDLKNAITARLVVVWDGPMGHRFFATATLVSVNDHALIVEVDGYRRMAIARDSVIAWHRYSDQGEKCEHCYNWRNAGSIPYPHWPEGANFSIFPH